MNAAASSFPTGLTLGGLTLSSPFLLAPLEGVSDVGFRRLCFEQGAGLTFTEMVRARGLAKRNKATYDLIDTHHATVTTGVQLLATSPTELQDALGVVEELAKTTYPHWQNIVAVDLNFGCPSKDIVMIGAGPAMLKRRAKLQAILEALKAFKTSTSLNIQAVSCKIRLGLNQKEMEHKVFLPVVEIASGVGLDFITVHARHAGMRSRDPAVWSTIAEAKAVSRIPLIANGDIKTRADAEKVHALSGCDGFLIARSAIVSPWAFRALRGVGSEVPTVAEVEAERVRYTETASRVATKDKYRAFHAEAFARYASLARGEKTSSSVPKNAHM
jgi:tRNA-dihydrouridine synthase B